MADVTYTPDGNGTLYCSLCGINGAPIVDAVIHADWHDDYDARVWLQGATQSWHEWEQWDDLMLTPTERAGAKKVAERAERVYTTIARCLP